VLIGNPNLKPEHANNYDLLYEKFLKPVGMFQAGVFFKQLSAPQVTTTIPGTVNVSSLPAGYLPPTLAPVIAQYPGDSITMYVNGKNAYLYGFEVSYQQHMTYLPGILSGLGLAANYSYTASQEKGLLLRSDSPALLQQSPTALNISPSYDNKHFSFRMGMTYNGPCIYQYAYVSPALLKAGSGADVSGLGPTGPQGDIHTLAHYQVDAQITAHLSRHLSAMAYGLNLNNEVFGYYQGSTQFVNQREYYKPTFTAGLRYTFRAEQ
jgi:TonB-dependent receptor